ncbi:MAG: hypothetical protein PHX61_11025 [Alphaproteobacteria bacterium]|nr:hypothetical protein [Alphaproteobacteria bacterium]
MNSPLKQDLNPKEKQELARLVYRCTMWVSISDEEGGGSSRSAEDRVLKKRMQTLYRNTRLGTNEREILGIILANSQYWKSWCEDLIDLMDEIARYQERIPQKLAEMIMALAMDVATAFEERSAFSSFFVRAGFRIRNIFSSSGSILSPEEHASISPNERAALKELAFALKVDVSGL